MKLSSGTKKIKSAARDADALKKVPLPDKMIAEKMMGNLKERHVDDTLVSKTAENSPAHSNKRRSRTAKLPSMGRKKD